MVSWEPIDCLFAAWFSDVSQFVMLRSYLSRSKVLETALISKYISQTNTVRRHKDTEVEARLSRSDSNLSFFHLSLEIILLGTELH